MVGIDLTGTNAYVYWEWNTGIRSFQRFNGSAPCWAADPSEAWTNWAILYCKQGQPTGIDADTLTHSNIGKFVNYDFVDPAKKTTVDQNVFIQVEGAFSFPVVSHSDFGEGADLLKGTVVDFVESWDCTPSNGGGGLETPLTCYDDPETEWTECDPTPLILDLEGDGILTTTVSDPVLFDIDADGDVDLTSWTAVGADDAFLFLDLNHNLLVDNGRELFGNASAPFGKTVKHGFEALAHYDELEHGGNGDGIISAGDSVWGRLRLWIDRNHDGVSQVREILPLSSQQIAFLSLGYKTMGPNSDFGLDAAGNRHRYQGTYTARDGLFLHIRPLHDVFFKVIR